MAPRVEQVRLAEVAAQGTRAVPGGTATAADFGGNTGDQLVSAANVIDRSGERLNALAVRVATENNETAAKQADTDFNTVIRNTLFDPEKGYFTLKGKDALDQYKPTEAQLRKLQSDFAAKITNPEARRLFGDVATRRLDAAFDSMAKHSALERRQWVDGVSMARAMNAGDDAVAYADDAAKREAALNVGRQEIINNAKDLGEDPEITNRKLREYDTKVYKGIVERMITTDPMGAQRFYEDNKHRIDGQQQIGLERTLKEATGRRRAEDDVNSVMSPLPAGDRSNNIGNIVKSKFGYAGGKGKGSGPFETFTTPEHGVAAAMQTIDAKAKQNGGSITPLELIGGNGKVKGWAPADDGKDPMLKGNDPKSYATVLAKAAGIGVNDPLPLNDPAKMAAVLKAMNRHEHGKQTVPDAAYGAGVKLARGEALDPSEATKPAAPAEAKPAKTYTDPKEAAREIEANFATYAEDMKRAYGNDPERLDKALGVLRQRKALAEEAFAAQLKVDTENAWKIAITPGANGGKPTSRDAIAPELWVKLDPKTQEALDRQFEHNLKGTQARDDENSASLFYKLNRMAQEDPDAFKAYDLLQHHPDLPKERWNDLVHLQRSIVKGDAKEYKITDAMRVARLPLLQAGFDLGEKASEKDKAVLGQFQGALQDWITQYQEVNKKPPSQADVLKQVDTMLIQGMVRGSGWFGTDFHMGGGKQVEGSKSQTGARGSKKNHVFNFQVSPQERGSFFVPYDSIPADRRSTVERALVAKGLLPAVPKTRLDQDGTEIPDNSRQRVIENAYSAYLAGGGK